MNNTDMAIRPFMLNEQEGVALRARYDRCKEGATRSRYQAIWMYGTGYPVDEIIQVVGCSRSSLMNWRRTYLDRGAEGLEDERVGGNRSKLTAAQREDPFAEFHAGDGTGSSNGDERGAVLDGAGCPSGRGKMVWRDLWLRNVHSKPAGQQWVQLPTSGQDLQIPAPFSGGRI